MERHNSKYPTPNLSIRESAATCDDEEGPLSHNHNESTDEDDLNVYYDHHNTTDGSISSAHSSPTRGSTATTAKPVLKKSHHHKPEIHGSSSQSNSRHLKWDEDVIEEHDQLRGTRMRIDEPQTPFTHYDSGAESDDSRRAKSPANQKPTLSWDVLQTRLDSVAAVRDAYPSSPSSSQQGGDGGGETDQSISSDAAMEDRKNEMKQREFREHRKRHYNEMELVRKFRREHLEDGEVNIDSDESDDDDYCIGQNVDRDYGEDGYGLSYHDGS